MVALLTPSSSKSSPAEAPCETGLFASGAPLGYASNDTNLYRYVGNSPTNATDPSGLEPPKEAKELPLPPEPEHGKLWVFWNWLSSIVLPAPVAAAEGLGDGASAYINRLMMERAEQVAHNYGENSAEADYARREYEARKEGKLAEFHAKTPPPPPRVIPGVKPFAPAGQ